MHQKHKSAVNLVMATLCIIICLFEVTAIFVITAAILPLLWKFSGTRGIRCDQLLSSVFFATVADKDL